MRLEIRKLRKRYGRHLAVADIDLSVEAGEFAVVLGPSGCGKTTTLRCLAGLEKPDSGEISIGRETVFAKGVFMPPERRNIGMIFQSYALWPHMTVFQNVAFPFESRGRRGPDVARRIKDVLAMVGLEALSDRSASLLSGGQMQRVALARALACEPAALLFDEPLSNLDLKLRQHLRVELRELQQASGATAVFVTHDQAEAAALADRVIVMNEGRIEQDDSAEDLFSRPANRFVADFIGVGNLLPFQPIDRIGERTWRGRIGNTPRPGGGSLHGQAVGRVLDLVQARGPDGRRSPTADGPISFASTAVSPAGHSPASTMSMICASAKPMQSS